MNRMDPTAPDQETPVHVLNGVAPGPGLPLPPNPAPAPAPEPPAALTNALPASESVAAGGLDAGDADLTPFPGGAEPSRRTFRFPDLRVGRPRLDREFIEAVAHGEWSASEGATRVRRYHAELFAAGSAAELTALRGAEGVIARRVGAARAGTRVLTRLLNGVERYRDDERPGAPWTFFDRAQCVMFFVLSVVFQVLDVVVVGTVLRGSHAPAFEEPWRAYLSAMMPVALALGVKLARRRCATLEGRGWYLRAAWLGGLVGGTAWVCLLAQSFPEGLTSTAQLLDSLTDTPTAAARQMPVWLIAIGSLAGALLASGFWMEAEEIHAAHRRCERTDNPPFLKTRRDLDAQARLEREEAETLGGVRGLLEGHVREERAFLEKAAALYECLRREVADRREIRRRMER